MIGANPPEKSEGYSNGLFADLVESYYHFTEKGIPPSVEWLGLGGQNPLIIAAFRRIGSAEARKHKRDRLRQQNAADAQAAINSGS